jgi:uncharacterized protein
MRLITTKDVDRLTLGALLLGGGCGATNEQNDGTIGEMLSQALAVNGPVRLMEPEEADPAGLGVRLAIIGSDVCVQEKLPAGTEMREALHALESYCGERVTAVLGWEVASANGLMPLILAAQAGLPVVDVDGMGRAFPRIDQSTYAVAGLPITPCAITEPGGNRVVVESSEIEHLARMVTVEFGGWAVIACKPLRLSDAIAAGVPRAWSRALELGNLWLPPPVDRSLTAPAANTGQYRAVTARRPFESTQSAHVVAERAAASGGFLLARGKVTEVRWEPQEGFARGTLVLQVLDNNTFVRLEMQGEYLVALRNGEPVVTCPDIICCMDADTGRPVGTARIDCGYVIDVVVLPAPRRWLHPDALRRVDPRAFGYDIDYVPLRFFTHGPQL